MQAISMEASQQHGDLTEPHVEMDKEASTEIRQTRGRTKLAQRKETNAAGRGDRVQKKVVGKKKNLPKASSTVHPKNKGKQVSVAIVDTMLGNLERSVADVAELRRKRDEDAMRCGRTTRTVKKAVSLDPRHTEMRTHCEERGPQQNMNRNPQHAANACYGQNKKNPSSSGGPPHLLCV